MKETKRYRIISMLALMLAATLIFSGSSAAFEEGGLVLLNSHAFTWTDPDSGGSVIITENVYEGCYDVDGSFNPHDMTWEYVVYNIDYDPIPGVTNGFSGFQVLFPGPVDELYNQLSPAIGGPWDQNAHSGVVNGAEWDAPLPGVGIMPCETGVFSFCANEREDVVTEGNWAHTWGLGIPEPIVDADGTVSRFSGVPGAVEVAIGSALTPWPTGFDIEGIDWFDNDDSCTWTPGDDLHVEGSAYSGALRDGLHDDSVSFLDPVVLDLDLSFFNGQPVDVDLESGTVDPSGQGGSTCPGVDPLLMFHDANGITNWDDGEDIVLDVNNNGIFDFAEIINTQTFIFNGPMSAPGDKLYELDIACSEDNKICKKVKYMDENRDGYIEVGEEVEFLQVIQVHNPTGQMWSDVKVSDNFGAEIEVVKHDATQGTVVLTTKGNSEKVVLDWDVGDLDPGETANLVLRTKTDITPGGDQSYTECSYHEYNSGAVLKFLVEGNKKPRQESYDTGAIIVSVLTPGLAGDCDLDGFIDETELNLETDPHDPADYPSCGGSSIVDICIDMDGTASRYAGTLADAQVLKMDVLTSWPTGFWNEGIDMFDTDGNGVWSPGDDLHVEDPVTHPGAIRNAVHDDFRDPLVLDLDDSLDTTPGAEPVDCDLESGSFCAPTLPGNLKFYDANGNLFWGDGEDIILDVNGNGVFD